MFIGLAGMVATGGTVVWTDATPAQSPASVTHYADEDDMHWVPIPGGLSDQVEDSVPSIPLSSEDDMHW